MVDISQIQGPGGFRVAAQGALERLELSRALTNLTQGSQINATVLQANTNGIALLKTNLGEFAVLARSNLAKGDNLNIQVLINNIPNGGVNFQARIISVNGAAPVPASLNNQTQVRETTSPFEGDQVQALTTGLSTRNIDVNKGNNPNLAFEHVGFDIIKAVNPKAIQHNISPDVKNVVPPGAAIVSLKQDQTINAVLISTTSETGKFIPQLQADPGLLPKPNNAHPSDILELKIISANIAPESEPKEAGKIKSQQSIPKIPGKDEPIYTPKSPSEAISQVLSGKIPPNLLSEAAESVIGLIQNLLQTTSKKIAPTNIDVETPSFTATVIGTEKSGEAVLKSPLGMLKLDPDVALSPGTDLTAKVISVIHSDDIPFSEIDERARLESAILLAGKYTGLGDAVDTAKTLMRTDQYMQMVSQSIPLLNQDFISKLFGFLTRIRSTSSSVIPGALKSILEQHGKTELLKRINKDFSNLQFMSTEQIGNGWNAMIFPIFDGQNVKHTIFYKRRQQDPDDPTGQVTGTRFVVELDLEALGDMQFDGLVRGTHAKKQFNLVIRSHQEISDVIKNDIITIFNNAAELTGVNGYLEFDVTSNFPVRPLEEMLEPNDSSIVA